MESNTRLFSRNCTMSLDIRLILTITVALVCNSINLGATFSQCHGSFQSYFWVTALFFPITTNLDSLEKYVRQTICRFNDDGLLVNYII